VAEPTVASLPAASYETDRGDPFSVTEVSFGVVPEYENVAVREAPRVRDVMFPMAS
jgi:hypothetical protein